MGWTLWTGCSNSACGNWCHQVCTISNFEDFSRIYSFLRSPSQLAIGSNLYLFKQSLTPIFEDPSCANGGQWSVTFSEGKSDGSWMQTLQALIEDKFDNGYKICGAALNVFNREQKVALWTKNAAIEAAQVSIGKQWKQILEIKNAIGFIFHEDAEARGGNTEKCQVINAV